MAGGRPENTELPKINFDKLNLDGFFKSLFPEGFPQPQDSCEGCPENVDTDTYEEAIRILTLAEQYAIEDRPETASILIQIADRYAQL